MNNVSTTIGQEFIQLQWVKLFPFSTNNVKDMDFEKIGNHNYLYKKSVFLSTMYKKIDVYLIDEIRDKKNKEMYFIFFHETFV